MTSVFSNIQGDIYNYADAISGIMGVNVEIIDESLMRIAGTGEHRHIFNGNVVKNDYTYRHTLQMRGAVPTKNPGKRPLCQLYEKHHYCSEMPDLDAFIFLNNRMTGIIEAICSTQAQRSTLPSQIDKSVTFIE